MDFLFKNYIKNKPAKKALEFGYGPGWEMACLRGLKWQTQGIDLKDGVDLNKPYKSQEKYDLVYANYVLHFLNKPEILIESMYQALKKNGEVYISDLHESDKQSNSKINEKKIKSLLYKFKKLKISVHDFYDNDEKHKHWHKIINVIAQK